MSLPHLKYFLIAKGRLKKGWNGSENAFGAKNYHDLISLFLAFLDFEKTTCLQHFLFTMATRARFVRYGC